MTTHPSIGHVGKVWRTALGSSRLATGMMPQITAQAICLILALAALLVAVLCGYGTSTSYISGLVATKHHALPKGWTWNMYHNHSDLVDFLDWLGDEYGHVATVHSIGQSVEGRDLLVVKLSGSRLNKHQRPLVKLVGGIHGNEQACPEVLLRLIHYLAGHYGHSRRITELLDTTEVYVLPAMNPDGCEADTRVNANAKDLNRNFPLDPLPFDPPGPPSENDSETVQSWRKVGAGPPQPEVQGVMDWSRAHDFTLSASLHQGALVANYPLDSCDTQGLVRSCPTPDDPLPLFLATAYAHNHATMRFNANDSFVNGTVQGAQWYTLLGGMQDWVYWELGSLELTLELNPVMKPPAEEVSGTMWQHNLPALLRFIELSHFGLHGRVVDAETLEPLQATVEVLAPTRHRPVDSTKHTGEFYMLLAPDVVYCLLVHARHPQHKHYRYQPARAAVFRLGGATIMNGRGLHGLTEHVVVFAERVDDDNNLLNTAANEAPSSSGRVEHQQAAHGPAGVLASKSRHVSASRRLLLSESSQASSSPGQAAEHMYRSRRGVLRVGQAPPDVCWTL